MKDENTTAAVNGQEKPTPAMNQAEPACNLQGAMHNPPQAGPPPAQDKPATPDGGAAKKKKKLLTPKALAEQLEKLVERKDHPDCIQKVFAHYEKGQTHQRRTLFHNDATSKYYTYEIHGRLVYNVFDAMGFPSMTFIFPHQRQLNFPMLSALPHD